MVVEDKLSSSQQLDFIRPDVNFQSHITRTTTSMYIVMAVGHALLSRPQLSANLKFESLYI